jgi:hypothetical protein
MRRSLYVVLIAAALILPMYIRTLCEAKARLQEGKEKTAIAAEEALTPLRKSVSWDSPFNPYSKEAAALLRSIGSDEARPAGLRINALRELVRGLSSSRSMLSPRTGAEMKALETQIDRLAPHHASTLKLENPPADPNYRVQLFAQFLFWGWVAAVLVTVMRGFSSDGSIKRCEALQGAVGIALFYILWLYALANA